MGKGKLHEVLAVESSLKATATSLSNETIRSFSKDHLFSGVTKTHQIFDENQQHLVQPTESRKVEATVNENLAYLFDKAIIPYWDAVAQKDEANQRAKADIIIDGKVIVKDVPGTTLLGLETKLKEMMQTFKSIPTLAPGVAWVAATGEREGVSVAPEEVRMHSVKEPDFKVLYEATKEHRAQIKEFERTVDIGKYTIIAFSGAISSYEKALYMTRLQDLMNAVKKARQRANSVEVTDVHIGKALTDYLLG